MDKEQMKLIFEDGEEIEFTGVFNSEKKENKDMSCTVDKPCNCQINTPYTPYEPITTTSTYTWSVAMEKPAQTIKRRVNDFQEQVKNMLNTLVEELGIKVDIMEINLNENGDKIDEVLLYWDVEK